MAMSPHIGDREKDKFRETGTGETVVAVTIEGEEDTEGDEQEIREDGSAFVTDADATALLQSILLEMKKMNTHLALVTGHDNNNNNNLDQC